MPALLAAVGEVMSSFGLESEYTAIVEPDTLVPVQELAGEALLLAAVRVGGVRLIDNMTLAPGSRQSIHVGGVATTLA